MQDQGAEHALVGRLRAGDGSAVFDLETAYGPKIYQLALRYMKNREDAEEITQDVLFRVFQKISAFRGDAALSSWDLPHHVQYGDVSATQREIRSACRGFVR